MKNNRVFALSPNLSPNVLWRSENESENKKNNPLGLSGFLWCWEVHF